MKKIFTRMLFLAMALGIIMPEVNAISIVPPSGTNANPDPATIKAAIESFKNLSKKEKKEKIKEVKKAVKEFKAQKRAHMEPAASTILQIIFAILIPPLGVFLHEGEINSRFWIDLILTLLFFIPGMIYALIVVLGDTKRH
jgi:uncharacterized membrane protein YqaE (UPF0057 family)